MLGLEAVQALRCGEVSDSQPVLERGVSLPSCVSLARLPCLARQPWVHLPGTCTETGQRLQFLGPACWLGCGTEALTCEHRTWWGLQTLGTRAAVPSPYSGFRFHLPMKKGQGCKPRQRRSREGSCTPPHSFCFAQRPRGASKGESRQGSSPKLYVSLIRGLGICKRESSL